MSPQYLVKNPKVNQGTQVWWLSLIFSGSKAYTKKGHSLIWPGWIHTLYAATFDLNDDVIFEPREDQEPVTRFPLSGINTRKHSYSIQIPSKYSSSPNCLPFYFRSTRCKVQDVPTYQIYWLFFSRPNMNEIIATQG